jgi:pilus assembly protein Flp/PilA
MFDVKFDVANIVLVFSAIWAIVCDWFPGVAEWFGKLSELKKKQVIVAGLIVVITAGWGAGCGGLITSSYACDAKGYGSLLPLLVAGFAAAYGAHGIFKPTAAYKREQKAIQASKGQGMVEYGLILALVAVVVLSALSIMGPLIQQMFNTINAAL